MKNKSIKIMYIIAICFFIASGFMLYKGYDKITNYYMSESFSSLNENAYVGGDAYNYIINGNYATGFFVLSMGFLLSGMICMCASAIIKSFPEHSPTNSTEQTIIPESTEEIPDLTEELPDL